ncbi:MAG: response regulator transcription factor [Planctomycetes bacterium]|nr:response regulator transcription factor [Planctomycetota bacterium]
MKKNVKIKVALADDHKIVRDGLRSLLENQKDIKVVAEATDGVEIVQYAKKFLPDIVVMDVNMSNLNGIEATRQITQNFPRIKVLPLSMYSDKHFVLEMLKAGSSGYMLKDGAFEELVSAIHIIISGNIYLSPCIASILLDGSLNRTSSDMLSAFSVLTDREREVLQLLADGKTTKEAASNLDLSAKTIESHRKKIMDKLKIYSVAELTKYAIREGLTDLK